MKIDIEKYFEHVDHPLLKEKLARRFKGRRFLKLLDAIIDSYSEQPGKGLPIGSLTSQYFANFYLECCDRFIEQLAETMGYVRYIPVAIEISAFIARPLHSMASLKLLTIDWLLFVISPCHEMNMTHTEHLNLKRHGYMDDMIWFCHDKSAARSSLGKVVALLETEKLNVKSQRWIQPSCRGGSWINNGRNLRSAYRNNWHIGNDNYGFRLARAHFAAGWRIRTRRHPVMAILFTSCKKQGCRGVSNQYESPPCNRFILL